MSDTEQLLKDLEDAINAVNAAATEYNICRQTGAACTVERKAYLHAVKQKDSIRKRLAKARRRMAYGD